MPTLQIRLFGPMEVYVAGEPMPPLRSRRGLWALALLALRAGKEMDRSRLAGILWPESTEEQALSSLRRTLTDLRQALGDAAARILAPTPRTLALDVCDCDIDAVSFDRLAAQGDVESAACAVELYRGPLLEACGEEWAAAERTAREGIYLDCLDRLAAAAMERGDPGAAVAYTRRALETDPLRESDLQQLMQALAAQGDYAGVVAVYRDFRLRLRRDLNTDVSAQTAQIYQALRASGQEAARPPVAVPAELPAHAPVRVLPQPLTNFVGREDEMREIPQCLRTARLITLIGPGGIGKTRLAVQVASENADVWTDGACFVDLAALTEPALLASTIAGALGFQETASVALKDELIAWLRPREVLLILDNCEHIVPACAQMAADLLAAAPRLRVLATSRQALGITGEVLWRVRPLDLPDEPESTALGTPDDEARLMRFPAVRLFVERARAAAPGFSLTVQNAGAATQVCRRLDGIPLALELAAARVKVMSVQQIAERLDDRFRLLTTGSAVALPRQQTLRALIDWSYQLLTDVERVLLRRLSVFSGGFSLEAVEAIASDKDEEVRMTDESTSSSTPVLPSYLILDTLSGLVDKSLVSVDDRAAEPRFYLLESTREYAHDILERSDEEDATRSAHADYFQALAERGAEALAGPEPGLWLDRMEVEQDNLRAAIEWRLGTHATEQDQARALELVAACWRFWRQRDHLAEARQWSARVLQGPEIRTAARAMIALHEGWLARSDGDETAAVEAVELAHSIFIEVGDPARAALVHRYLGGFAMDRGDYEAARDHYNYAIAQLEPLDEPDTLAAAVNALGRLVQRTGDVSEAERLYRRALDLWRKRRSVLGIAAALNNLGTVAFDRGDYAAARSMHEEVLDIDRRIGNKGGVGWALDNMAETWQAERQWSRARDLYLQSLAIFQEIGNRPGAVDCIDGLAECAVALDPSPAGARATAMVFGAATAERNALRFVRPPEDRSEHDLAVRSAIAVLGEAEYLAAEHEGARMTVEEAIKLVNGQMK